MTQLKTGFMTVATATLITACASGFEATYDHDPSNNFTEYKTFAWVSEHPMNESDREDTDGTINAAVDAILAGFPPL